jgi:hypothetical protein
VSASAIRAALLSQAIATPTKQQTDLVVTLTTTVTARRLPAVGLFAGFSATMVSSDFAPSRFPSKERPHVPRSQTTPGQMDGRDDAPTRIAFRWDNGVGTQNL